jgi:type I restriction enzyme R subunit
MGLTHTEMRFEDAVEAGLLDSGWTKGDARDYQPQSGLSPAALLAFVRETQPEEWEQLRLRYGGDDDSAERRFLTLVAAEIDRRGTLEVLRRGVRDMGTTLRLAYFRPAHGLSDEVAQRYAANRLHVVRQLAYSDRHHNTLDVALLVNGVPVATMELKNPLTGQTVEDAKQQYRSDRDPRDTLLGRRALVHFAVDPDWVFLTTRLQFEATRFLPFNQGTAGPGRAGGAGNPSSDRGYATDYLWQEALERDSWMDLLGRFLHASARPGTGRRRSSSTERDVIFPRYHQWHAVLTLAQHARDNGPGSNYLIQHSAGSGKSNSIAWLAHRLMTLHDDTHQKVFHKVVVVTDRVVLDRQLQDTIFQFDHTPGVVLRVDRDSQQLADALSGGAAQIIITTIQKFPFVLDKVGDLQGSYAVIVDEAHSSQTGETAKALKTALGSGPQAQTAELDDAERADAQLEAESDPEEQLARAMTARGKQANLSFFAFTATPKSKTLQMFGVLGPDQQYRAFHLYSMRQAIEEEFILDVLQNYMTYQTYWRLANASSDDPELNKRKAAAALARFVSLHPTNLAQKAEIIVEHFRQHTAAKIGGRAKAMVVTRSRLHAVRYKQAVDEYLARKGYRDTRALVAFSGQVVDAGAGGEVVYTETGMNGFADSQTKQRFEDDYQVLIVAEKYQTGYDQPLLHTMYVDKKLESVKAVQTLSRLNRTTAGKVDTFVLDFVNTAEDIQEAFRPYYETTVTEPTDPRILYTAATELEQFQVIDQADCHAFSVELLAGGERAHAELYRHLQPARSRYDGLPSDDQDEFRAMLTSFLRAYAFLAQVVPFADPELEVLYLYGRYLLLRLPGRKGGVDLGAEVELTHLRIEATGRHDVSLGDGAGEATIPGFTGTGAGSTSEEERARLSSLIDVLNEKFGLGLTAADQLYFEQLEEALIEDPVLAQQARANTEDNFTFGFNSTYEGAVIDRQTSNDELFRRLMDDAEFGDVVRSYLRRRVYGRLRDASADD